MELCKELGLWFINLEHNNIIGMDVEPINWASS